MPAVAGSGEHEVSLRNIRALRAAAAGCWTLLSNGCRKKGWSHLRAASDSTFYSGLPPPDGLRRQVSAPPGRKRHLEQGASLMVNIFVGNLSYQTSQDELHAAFAQYGSVERVNIVTDRDTGQPRGFAFVEMTERRDAETAIAQLNGAEMNGRAINVNEARPKPAGGGGGGFGGGRGRGGGGGRGGSGGGGGRGQRW